MNIEFAVVGKVDPGRQEALSGLFVMVIILTITMVLIVGIVEKIYGRQPEGLGYSSSLSIN